MVKQKKLRRLPCLKLQQIFKVFPANDSALSIQKLVLVAHEISSEFDHMTHIREDEYEISIDFETGYQVSDISIIAAEKYIHQKL